MTRGGDGASVGATGVVLTGFMGAGKTAVGRRLAGILGWAFVDTDDLIVAAAGRSIPAIFASERETGFRRREREAIASLAGRAKIVVATGGGAVTDPENAARLRAIGPIVWLRARPATLLSRVEEGADRPLLDGAVTREARLAHIEALLADRESAYARADRVVDTDALDEAACAEAVLRALDRKREEP